MLSPLLTRLQSTRHRWGAILAIGLAAAAAALASGPLATRPVAAATGAVCGTPGFATRPTASAIVGQTVTLYTSDRCSGGGHASYAFFIRRGTAKWKLLRGWGGPLVGWRTTGQPAGALQLLAWASAVPRGGPQATRVIGYHLDRTEPAYSTLRCTAAGIGTLPAASAAVGTTTTVYASGQCPGGVGAHYAFFLRRGSTGSWTLLRGWGGPLLAWSTAGQPPGPAQLLVWVSSVAGGSGQAGAITGYQLLSTAGAILPPGNPAATIQPSPNYVAACDASGTSTLCRDQALAALDNARALEGLPPLALPPIFWSLSPAEQLFVVVNEERTARGEAPFAGLTSALDSIAQSAAIGQTDPWPSSWTIASDNVQAWGGNLAVDQNVLTATYDWMYNDGYGSGNADCTSPTAAGCWGHRDNILATWQPANGVHLLMGAGSAFANYYAFQSMTQAFALAQGPMPALVYSWATAQSEGF